MGCARVTEKARLGVAPNASVEGAWAKRLGGGRFAWGSAPNVLVEGGGPNRLVWGGAPDAFVEGTWPRRLVWGGMAKAFVEGVRPKTHRWWVAHTVAVEEV